MYQAHLVCFIYHKCSKLSWIKNASFSKMVCNDCWVKILFMSMCSALVPYALHICSLWFGISLKMPHDFVRYKGPRKFFFYYYYCFVFKFGILWLITCSSSNAVFFFILGNKLIWEWSQILWPGTSSKLVCTLWHWQSNSFPFNLGKSLI